MKIIHTADLHLGQVIYQNYERRDEHAHFFSQLLRWCKEERPDALIVCGDVFDIQQPSNTTRAEFNDYFVQLHQACPDVKIVIAAGNHDSASRIEADHKVWALAGVHVVGMAPSTEMLKRPDGWQDRFIVELESGFIAALPYATGERKDLLQSILDRIAERNVEGKPVVMMGHQAVAGMDCTGHGFEIGKIKTLALSAFGEGFDYLALGHIHMPQTIGYPDDRLRMETVTYPAGVARYSGSVLHVSCDEQYPHTVSVVEIDHHGGEVKVRQLRIDELRHFYVLPLDGSSFDSEKAALAAVDDFIATHESGYIRLRVDYNVTLAANFSQQVYDRIEPTGEDVRYNPKIIWTGCPEHTASEDELPQFEVEELQQMDNPLDFIEKTIDQYPGLNLDMLREAFEEIEAEMKRMDDAEEEKKQKKSKKVKE